MTNEQKIDAFRMRLEGETLDKIVLHIVFRFNTLIKC